MTVSNKTHRALATLKLPKSVPALIAYAAQIIKAMTGNAYFANPTPSIVVLQKGADDLMAAQTGAQARTKGAVALRNEKKAALVTLLEELRTFVQSQADANPENGASMIESSGISLRKATVRPALGFHAKAGSVSGTVKVAAPSAARRASYEWQYSIDGGKTWITMPPTLQSRTSVVGLQPQTSVQFKYRPVMKTGPADWSQAISFIVQ